MANRIYAEQTVSMSDLRKKPAAYFLDEPVAVLSNNKPAGYTLSADLFEAMVTLLEEQQQQRSFVGQFRPTTERLQAMADQCAKRLQQPLTEEDFEFIEE